MADNFAFERRMMPQVIEILSRHAMRVVKVSIASSEQDTKQATDLAISITGGAVGVRVRTYASATYPKRRRDFTIRCESFYGFATEIDKLREGWGDFYLYAWEDCEGVLSEYMLLSLSKVRDADLLNSGQWWFQQLIPNVGDPTKFCAIPIQELIDHDCVLVHTIDGFPGKLHLASRAYLLDQIESVQKNLGQMRTHLTGV